MAGKTVLKGKEQSDLISGTLSGCSVTKEEHSIISLIPKLITGGTIVSLPLPLLIDLERMVSKILRHADAIVPHRMSRTV